METSRLSPKFDQMHPKHSLAIRALVAQLGSILSEKKYENLDQLTAGSRVKISDLITMIERYGRQVIGINTDDLSIVQLEDGSGWSVWANFETKEEGKSDLVLIMRILRGSKPLEYRAVLDDLRVT